MTFAFSQPVTGAIAHHPLAVTLPAKVMAEAVESSRLVATFFLAHFVTRKLDAWHFVSPSQSLEIDLGIGNTQIRENVYLRPGSKANM